MRQYERGADGRFHDGPLMDLLAEEVTAGHSRTIEGPMLAATHTLVGAVAGRLNGHVRGAAMLGLVSHAIADGVGHDDEAIGGLGQAVLGAAALGYVGRRHGWRSPAMIGAVAGAIPDVEIALSLMRGKPAQRRFIFPSHWQLRPGQISHPYRFSVPALPISAELCLVAALTGWLSVRKPLR